MDELLNQLMGYARATWHRRWYSWRRLGGVDRRLVLGVLLPGRSQASARVYVDTQTLLKPLLGRLTVEPNVDQQIQLMTRHPGEPPDLEKVARMTDMDIKAKTPQQTESMLNDLASKIPSRTPAGKISTPSAIRMTTPIWPRRWCRRC